MAHYRGRDISRYSLYICCISLLMMVAWGWGAVQDVHAAEQSTSSDSLSSPVVLAGSSVDLADVGVNILAGWLTGTTTAMEYSIDSTNGTNGTWVQAEMIVTPIQWQPGYLYVREQADPTNVRLVAVIQLGRDGSYIFVDPTVTSIAPTTVDSSLAEPVIGSPDSADMATTPMVTNDENSIETKPLVTIDPATDSTLPTIHINNPLAIQQLTANNDHQLAISIPKDQPSIQVPIEGSLLQALYEQQGSLIIVCPQVTYTLPIAILPQQQLIQSFINPPSAVTPITLIINISTPSSSELAPLQSIVNQQGLTMIGSPVGIQLHAEYNGQTVAVNPQGSDQSLDVTMSVPNTTSTPSANATATTAIVYHSDQTINPVPTVISPSSSADSQSLARIHGWSNGIYALIAHHPSFVDMTTHWSRTDVNDMASRLVVTGEKGGVFAPDRLVTRAEFAAMIVRALGLSAEPSKITFSDVHDSDWYAGVIGSASNHGLIEGYNDTTFRPNQQITREEASEILSHAMKLTGLSTDITTNEANAQLSGFSDRKQVSNWAVPALALAVKYHIVEGNQGAIEPQSDVSRAQATTMIRRLLQRSGWI
ncbi:S-layer homology domain-containing protein [Paenibacillus kyungheensis]|uniref:S-layer homology domain-containing protein n=1 Tax=Paenibacillus kyungheensis TaxID=1452732 RepID=A0AAX3M1A2_9BACL|nr:S-layer homology domain-containing protein [Paenibacillus kyungheensis]WCT55683.1 S-layer homology domain-containing protein [Paenibacillus kyungheensis]